MANKNDWEYVQYKMEEEGFDYCFKHYSNFQDIKDEEFHKLRLEYLAASEKLEKYVKKQK